MGARTITVASCSLDRLHVTGRASTGPVLDIEMAVTGPGLVVALVARDTLAPIPAHVPLEVVTATVHVELAWPERGEPLRHLQVIEATAEPG